MRAARLGSIVAITLLCIATVSGCGKPSASTPACTAPHALAENGHRGEQFKAAPKMVIVKTCRYRALLKTSFGNITIDLTPKTAPLAVNNFVFLATHRFYTNILFHRVIPGFMIQAGDPTGTGSGGAGYSFPIEAPKSQFSPGTVALANTGLANSNGSQFFICEGSACAQLANAKPPGYTTFGHVTSGMAAVRAIANVPTKLGTDGAMASPIKPVYIKSVTIYGTKLIGSG